MKIKADPIPHRIDACREFWMNTPMHQWSSRSEWLFTKQTVHQAVTLAFEAGYMHGHHDGFETACGAKLPLLAHPPLLAPERDEWLMYKKHCVEAIKMYRERTGESLVRACLAFGHNLEPTS